MKGKHSPLLIALVLGITLMAYGCSGDEPSRPTWTPYGSGGPTYRLVESTSWYVCGIISDDCGACSRSGKQLAAGTQVQGSGRVINCEGAKDINGKLINSILIEVKDTWAGSGGWNFLPQDALVK